MEQVYVKEANKEVWIDIGKNMGDPLCALEEAVKILQREVIRARANRDRGQK